VQLADLLNPSARAEGEEMSQGRSINPCERFGVYWAWGKCFWCDDPITFDACQIDHVIPVSVATPIAALRDQYGLSPSFEIDGFENWVPSCARCNRRKRAKLLFASRALLIHLQEIRDRVPKAKAFAEKCQNDREIAPSLANLQNAFQAGKITEQEILSAFGLLPVPSESVRLVGGWEIQPAEHGVVRVIQLSPLYTEEGQKRFKEDRARKIARLSSLSEQLAADIAKVDSSTEAGREQIDQLALEKAEIDKRLAEVKATGTGYNPRFDRPPGTTPKR
jgi:hypothetical protein